jgi:hypothetical protein
MSALNGQEIVGIRNLADSEIDQVAGGGCGDRGDDSLSVGLGLGVSVCGLGHLLDNVLGCGDKLGL